MTPEELAFLESMRVGRLATIGADGRPALVPICYALIDTGEPSIVSVLDEKPKQVPDTELARIRNIRRDPRVSLLVDRYEEDWSRLAFVQVRGGARIVEPGDPTHAIAIVALHVKYPQYHAMAIDHRPVILLDDLQAASWGVR